MWFSQCTIAETHVGICPITGDDPDHLDKVTSARLLQCNLTCFLFVINMYFVECSFETM